MEPRLQNSRRSRTIEELVGTFHSLFVKSTHEILKRYIFASSEIFNLLLLIAIYVCETKSLLIYNNDLDSNNILKTYYVDKKPSIKLLRLNNTFVIFTEFVRSFYNSFSYNIRT